MDILEKQDTIYLWEIEWNHYIEQIPNDDNSIAGCLLDVYSHTEIGKFALMYIPAGDIRINSDSYKKLLDEIKNKFDNNKPFIIFNDNKYKELCKEWNSSSNTMYSKNDFEFLINKK